MPKKSKPPKTSKKSAKPKVAAKSIKTIGKAKAGAARTVKSAAKAHKVKTAGAPPRVVAPKPPSKQFAGAVAALESGIKLMYAEDYAKAVKACNKVIAEYPEEPEIQASAKARIQACEKKL